MHVDLDLTPDEAKKAPGFSRTNPYGDVAVGGPHKTLSVIAPPAEFGDGHGGVHRSNRASPSMTAR